jgi:transposase, IS30 family
MDEYNGSTIRRLTPGNPRSAGCAETCSSGAEGGPGKRTGSNPGTAPLPDPYIIGKGGKSQIATLVERATRYLLLQRIPYDRTADRVAIQLASAIRRLPESLRRSLTWDQGVELAGHAKFTIATNVPVYFCDPHSPWQRGSNENTNGLLRQYFPKGTDLSGYTQAELDSVADKLNTRPRETLGWKTPAEKLDEFLKEAV